jgi:predicted Zn-dependent protease
LSLAFYITFAANVAVLAANDTNRNYSTRISRDPRITIDDSMVITRDSAPVPNTGFQTEDSLRVPNLQVSTLSLSTAGDITTMKPVKYAYTIGNIGDAPLETSLPGQISITGSGGKAITNFDIAALQPGQTASGTFTVTYVRKGTYTVTVITPYGTKSVSTFADFSKEIRSERWSSTHSLSVQAYSSATSIFTHAELQSYLSWNEVSRNVKLLPYETHPNDASLNAQFEIKARSLPADTGGQARLTYSRNNLTRVVVELNTNLTKKADIAGLVIHEFGHGLGLMHPICSDKSVMHWTPSHPDWTNEITDRDRHNLLSVYN